MFQSFDAAGPSPGSARLRLARLREAMRRLAVDAFLLPRADMFQGEYVAPSDAHLAWLTGFSGSAGFALATQDRAALFVDGRYRVQARAEVDSTLFEVIDWPDTQAWDWLATALPDGGKLGLDPWLMTVAEVERLRERLAPSGILASQRPALIDACWQDRPPPPAGRVSLHPDELAGESAAAKRARLAEALRKAGQRAALICAPDSLSWLLNIRGSDIPRVPVVQGYAILHDDARVDVFVRAGAATPPQFGPEVMAALGPEVRVLAMSGDYEAALRALKDPVLADKASLPQAAADILEARGVELVWGRDPCLLPKARKNAAELAGARAAHLRDGAAVVEFLAWLDAQEPESLTEIDVVTRLEACRQATGRLRDISFDTIAGAGPNGAIVHYRVTEAANRRLASGELLLVDSGGQYADGTTDITRTLALGAPGAEECAAFTRVLKGMIAISMTRWPKGLAGRDLDALARWHLWQAGQDYDHGTGHGVGSYLSVHEGPQRLSRLGEAALEPGMILSNEPGYYREGAFGIRIENLVAVQAAPALPGGDAREMRAFETLTLAPIDRRLILTEMLSGAERGWLDAYHVRVLREIGPLVGPAARDWLARACAPL